jgi:fructose-1,6-bisphosphatase I
MVRSISNSILYFPANIIPAGGQAVDSKMNRLLEVVPEHIHDRSGIFMGSYDEVQKVLDINQKYKK